MYMAVPKAMLGKYNEIKPMVAAFCDDRLDEEYKALCLKLLEKLCRKQPSPLLGGRTTTWAASIVYAVCANNFVFGKDNPHSMTSRELASAFGLAASTVGSKATDLRKMFDMSYGNGEWLIKEYIRDNPAVWMLSINGFIQDVRSMPAEVQQLAYARGLIPWVPADKEDESD
jgi:hypothetical protein